ncbi:hypothetical protein CLOM_g5065 [Closterium sp. NIES-68]|nr:hypothetical protein CLOM_g5065 [Closterium sp. NIES-68]GJP64519.1 hypothetical protein CLOP_g21495 [Closterium sp. NIES-67]
MAFTTMQPAAQTDPVIVLLPDGSIRLYHEQLMQVRDVLKDFPSHGLASLNHTATLGPPSGPSPGIFAPSWPSRPPNAVAVPPERFLRPGGTYCLLENPDATKRATTGDAASEACIDDSDSPSGNAVVVSCFTPRAARSSTRQRSAFAAANHGGSSGRSGGLERAASMPPIQSLPAALMPTTPRKSTIIPPAPPTPRHATPLSRTSSGADARPTAAGAVTAIPNLVSPRAAAPAAASALISPRAPHTSASALVSPRAPPAAASSLISPRALLSSGSRKLARALTVLPRPRRSGNPAARERDGSDTSQVPCDVSNHGASGPWSLMDLLSPTGGGGAGAWHVNDGLGGDDINWWESAISDLNVSRSHTPRDEERADGLRRQRYSESARSSARHANWSGGLTPRGLPLLSPVDQAAAGGERTQQQPRRMGADSTKYMRRVASQGTIGGVGRSTSTESSCSSNGGDRTGSRPLASQPHAAGSSSACSASSTSNSTGRLQAASHRLSLFKSLRLQVARPTAAAVLGVHAAGKAAATAAPTAGEPMERVLTDGVPSPGGGKLAHAAAMVEAGSYASSPGGAMPCVTTLSSSSNGSTRLKDWLSARGLSAPNTPLSVSQQAAPIPAPMKTLRPAIAASRAAPTGPSMRTQCVNAPKYALQPFSGSSFPDMQSPMAPLHAMS